MAGAEIINGEIDAAIAQGLNLDDGALGVFHRDRLGEFQFEQVWRQVGQFQRVQHGFGEAFTFELHGRDIDGDGNFNPQRAPAGPFTAGSAQDPVADLADQATFLGGLDEGAWR